MAGMTQEQQMLGFDPLPKKTRKEIFLEEMNRVVPWAALVGLIQPHVRGAHQALGGRPPFAVETMLRFRHLLEKQQLAPEILRTFNAHLAAQGLMLETGTLVDATLIAAPSSTKNAQGERDPEMHQTKKGNQWHFGMKAHIGVDAESGLVHTVIGTGANVNDVTQATQLLHGQEQDVFADAGYQGVDKRPEAQGLKVNWHIAMRPGKRAALDLSSALAAKIDRVEQIKASIRAKVEHPFRVIKQQFGHAKVRYRGLAKNTARLQVMFALGNVWMARRQLLAVQA